MAIYRPRRARWPFVVAGFVVGVAVGLGIAAAALGDRPRDLDEASARIEAALTRAAGLLEVVEIEYREAVVDGQVVRETELEGARDALRRSRAEYDAVRGPLGRVAPERSAAIDAGYERLGSLVEARAPATEVAAEAEALRRLLAG